jgi:protein-disulfide isomerase
MDDHSNNTSMNSGNNYLIPVAIIAGFIIVALVLLFTLGGSKVVQQAATANNQQGAAQAVNIKNLKTENEAYIGSATAPVTMAVFFDYQCPFCKQFDLTVLSQLDKNYIQSGKLRVVFKDFDFLGNDSITGAEFGRAVWEAYPAQYGAWLTAMFNAQDEEGDKGFGNQATIVAMMKTQFPTMDTAKLVSMIATNKTKYDAEIDADRAEGASYGIQGTPSVIVGTTLLQGAQTYQTVANLIDAQLKK